MCFQFTHFPCDDWENIYIYIYLSYFHHQIGSMNYYLLFRIRSSNNGMRCMSFYILILKNPSEVVQNNLVIVLRYNVYIDCFHDDKGPYTSIACWYYINNRTITQGHSHCQESYQYGCQVMVEGLVARCTVLAILLFFMFFLLWIIVVSLHGCYLVPNHQQLSDWEIIAIMHFWHQI